MKILVEGTPIYRTRSGVGQYLYRLFKALLASDKDNDYTFFGYIFIGKHFTKPFPKSLNVRYRLIRLFPSKLHNVLIRRATVPPIDLLTAYRPDLSIFTNFVRLPLLSRSKSITFVYDLSYLIHADKSNDKNSRLLRQRVPTSLEKSNGVVTISKNSKNEIIEYYHINPRKIHIVYPALYHDEYYPRSKKEQTAVAKKFGINGKYILFTGTIEPRKNIERLLDAYAALPPKDKAEYTLVLAGGKGWKDEGIKAKLESLKNEKIIITGYVDDADLPPLYSGASLFVFPSLYEGWGMPIVEAMACGVPVITANNSSLPEAAGDAAVMIDALDTNDITKQMERVLGDKKLADQMIKKGIKHAAKFSWEQSAKDFKKVIDEVLAQ